jgi:hypothetical protein
METGYAHLWQLSPSFIVVIFPIYGKQLAHKQELESLNCIIIGSKYTFVHID